jgi:hypothetical protein
MAWPSGFPLPLNGYLTLLDPFCKKRSEAPLKLILPSHDTSGKITPDQDGVLTQILRGSRTIAVVGLSPKADRPSHRVAAYLQAAGYEIIPVNPGHERLLGVRAYADLAAVPD